MGYRLTDAQNDYVLVCIAKTGQPYPLSHQESPLNTAATVDAIWQLLAWGYIQRDTIAGNCLLEVAKPGRDRLKDAEQDITKAGFTVPNSDREAGAVLGLEIPRDEHGDPKPF